MQNNQFEGGTGDDGTNNMETTQDPLGWVARPPVIP